jgi:hypothetical protein
LGSAKTATKNGKVQQTVKKAKKKEKNKKAGLGLHTSAARRSYFHSAKHRNEVVLGPNDIITTDFCYGFLEFSPTIALRLPGGVSFDLMKYWDGQPVRFVCCERKKGDSEGTPWGRMFWCVSIELAEGDAKVAGDDID